ncbi:ubiquinol oxidase subunit II [uncultured Sphingomonas sp.]|uniref:ubiquinol oxidase subunit II n=1 Tax=uncultured Sphingomonas sp. TaxID=158754 RepID=UPI0025FCE4FF|nr:ubiquinol oxidase subunit II [uncultured Sphingomonas sp.]
MRIGWPWFRGCAGVGLCAVAGALALPGCTSVSILNPAGPIAAANRTILFDALAIMLAIVVPTMIATLAFAWWFRAGNTRARYRPKFAYSGRIELIVWSIPLLVVLFLSGVIWIGSHDLDPARPIASRTPPLEVQVVSLDWKWLFIYPGQGVASVNEMVVPAGVPLRFRLTSASVMNSFFVPRLGSMIYTMNGMATTLNLRADRPGDYYGQSAHFSGDGFSDMHFRMRAVPAGDFTRWAAGVRGRGPALDGRSYAALARQSRHVAPFTYGAVAPDLFQAVVTQRLAPGPGPDSGRGGPQLSPKTPS